MKIQTFCGMGATHVPVYCGDAMGRGMNLLCAIAGINSGNWANSVRESINITVGIMKTQAKCFAQITSNTLSRLAVGASKLFIIIGGYEMAGLTHRQSVNVMIDEWDDILYQTSGTRLVESVCLLPDAVTLAYEFGYIGRARKRLAKKAQGLLFRSKNGLDKKCMCGGSDTGASFTRQSQQLRK